MPYDYLGECRLLCDSAAYLYRAYLILVAGPSRCLRLPYDAPMDGFYRRRAMHQSAALTYPNSRVGAMMATAPAAS